jgi:hypothetical protein
MKSASIAALLFALAMNAQAEINMLDLTPLYKDAVAANPGVEMIHPYLDYVDKDADGFMDLLRVSFNVHPIGSTAALFSTTTVKVDFPRPCVNPAEYTWSEIVSIKFLGSDSSRSHLAVGLVAGCFEADFPFDYKEGFKTFVYSAAVDAPSGPVWQKTYYLELLSFDEVNIDGDADKELALGMVIALPQLPDDASNLRTIGFEAEDGTVVFDAKRTLTR